MHDPHRFVGAGSGAVRGRLSGGARRAGFVAHRCYSRSAMWSPRSIVYPLPSGDAAPVALRLVLEWAQRLRIPLHVTPWPDGASGSESGRASEVRAQVEALRPDGPEIDLHTEAWTRRAFAMADWHTYVNAHDIDLVVLPAPDDAHTGPLLACPKVQPMVTGTTAAVLTLPQHAADAPFARILAPTDMTTEAVSTLHHAEAVAAFFEAQLDVLHVLTRRPYVALTPTDMLALDDAAATPRVATRRLRTWYHRHTHPSYPSPEATQMHIEQGDSVSAITRVAQAQSIDLIVLAATHNSPDTQPVSTLTENVLRRTTCAVLMTRPHHRSLIAMPRSSTSRSTVSS